MYRLLILLLVFYPPISFCFSVPESFYSIGYKADTLAQVDLNGDGRTEKISIYNYGEEESCFILNIDTFSIKKCGWEWQRSRFIILDIDTTDKYKEIAVRNFTPGENDKYLLFWYDGKSVERVGYLQNWPNFFGNGIVLVDDWIDFWAKRNKYVLDKKRHILELIPQDLYYVGVEGTVRESFPIYKTREDSTIVANLKSGSKVFFLVWTHLPTSYRCSFAGWYLIKSETGIVGWAKLECNTNKLILPWAE